MAAPGAAAGTGVAGERERARGGAGRGCDPGGEAVCLPGWMPGKAAGGAARAAAGLLPGRKENKDPAAARNGGVGGGGDECPAAAGVPVAADGPQLRGGVYSQS